MIVEEAAKALVGKPFEYYENEDGLPIKSPAVTPYEFVHYHQIHRYYQKFGLPHGNGWAREKEWVLEFLAHMDDLKIEIEIWHVKNQAKTS